MRKKPCPCFHPDVRLSAERGASRRDAKTSTTFLITHDLRSAENADRIVYLEGGKIVEEGIHSELMQLGQRYATLYRLQQTVNVR